MQTGSRTADDARGTFEAYVPAGDVAPIDDATPAECVEALRAQVDEVIRAGGLPPALERYLANIVTTVG